MTLTATKRRNRLWGTCGKRRLSLLTCKEQGKASQKKGREGLERNYRHSFSRFGGLAWFDFCARSDGVRWQDRNAAILESWPDTACVCHTVARPCARILLSAGRLVDDGKGREGRGNGMGLVAGGPCA